MALSAAKLKVGDVHTARLVEDLRMLSLSDLGALTYRKEPVLLAEVLDDALSAGRGAITANGMSVRTELDPALRVDADSDRLTQVFGNLLQNTLRYSESPAQLRVRLYADGGQARIDWEDSPPGVPEEDLPRLTERFYRVEASRSRQAGGTGLGLAIVKHIVLRHRGRLNIASTPGIGTTVSVYLPRADVTEPSSG